jgi:hypothetical protein
MQVSDRRSAQNWLGIARDPGNDVRPWHPPLHFWTIFSGPGRIRTALRSSPMVLTILVRFSSLATVLNNGFGAEGRFSGHTSSFVAGMRHAAGSERVRGRTPNIAPWPNPIRSERGISPAHFARAPERHRQRPRLQAWFAQRIEQAAVWQRVSCNHAD